ncbi:MAG: glycoside hydrolase family 9 protein [Pseudomonadota bacterium]
MRPINAIWILLVAVVSSKASALSPRIVVNQAGYLPHWQKVALLVDGGAQASVQVKDVESGRSVMTVSIGETRVDSLTGDPVRRIDFSALAKPGRYQLVAGDLTSYPFDISVAGWESALRLLLRGFYLQRCGVAIDDAVSNVRHAICHIEDGRVRHRDPHHDARHVINAAGGWHDAGDYGKYIATTTVAVAQLLSLYLYHRNAVTQDDLKIPESGNGRPDILDEAKVGLDWMLSMQRIDGAVYRKLSGTKWPHNQSPHQDTQPRFLYGVSTPDTAKFAAAMALAARAYRTVDSEVAHRYLKAAERAWAYLEKHPEQQFDYRDGDDSGSGPYRADGTDVEAALRYDWDDRLWAAAELYLTTGASHFAQSLKTLSQYMPYTLFEWKDPSSLGLLHYVLSEKNDTLGMREVYKQRLLDRAGALVAQSKLSEYRVANRRIVWGSNKMTVQEGLTLAYAWRFTGQRKFLTAAIDQVDYALGRNHFNKSFVSGLGANPVAHVSHLFAMASGQDIPGLFVGGPNELAQAGLAPKWQRLRSYVDQAKSYATNESAIDYNATLINLLGVLLDEYGKAPKSTQRSGDADLAHAARASSGE